MADDPLISGVGNQRPQRPRIPVRLHRNVSMIKTDDAHLAEELLSIKKLSGLVAGRLTETVLLIQPGQEQAVIEELRRVGQTPQIIRGGSL